MFWSVTQEMLDLLKFDCSFWDPWNARKMYVYCVSTKVELKNDYNFSKVVTPAPFHLIQIGLIQTCKNITSGVAS